MTQDHTSLFSENSASLFSIFGTFLFAEIIAYLLSGNKYAPMLKAEYPKVIISNVAVPQNEDVNSLLQGHSGDILNHLVNTRKEYNFLFSIEQEAPTGDYKSSDEKEKIIEAEPVEEPPKDIVQTGLDANNPYNLKYQGNEANYQIKGFKVNQLDSLKITLQIEIK